LFPDAFLLPAMIRQKPQDGCQDEYYDDSYGYGQRQLTGSHLFLLLLLQDIDTKLSMVTGKTLCRCQIIQRVTQVIEPIQFYAGTVGIKIPQGLIQSLPRMHLPTAVT